MANGDVPVKPGWKTTEFWITLLVQGISIAVLVGAYDPKIGADVTAQLPDKAAMLHQYIVAGIDIAKDLGAFLAMAWSGFGYAKSRAHAKALSLR